MNLLTLGYIRNNTRIPQSLGLCASDSRIPGFLDEAQERLIPKGLWIGTYGRFTICATQGCLTLPAQISAMERVAVCGSPTPVHDMWYEFLDNGYGVRRAVSTATGTSCCGGSGGCGPGEADLRGWYPSFDEVRGSGKKLRMVCDLATDVGKRVLLLGYDQNNNWIRTIQNSVYADGEIVLLAQSPGVTSANFFDGRMTGIQFLDDRDGQVWLYEYDTVALTQRLIGSYQYWETNPSYARYFFPSILSQTPAQGVCNQTTVDMIAKLSFMPVVKDTDYLVLRNVPALKEMCSAIKKAEDAADSSAANDIILKGETLAMRYLDDELEHYLGTGREVGVNFRGSSVGQLNPVETLI